MRINQAPIALSLVLGVALAGCVETDDESPELGEAASELSVWQWPNDVQIPLQDTTRQVGMAPYNGRLHMVYTDNAATNMKWSRYDGSTWSGELSVWQNTDSTPALADFNSRLHLIYKAAGEARLMMMDTGGSTWTSPVTIGRSLGTYVPHHPSAMAYDGKLYVAYCGSNSAGQSRVFVDRFDGTTWTAFHDFQTSSYRDYACLSTVIAPMPDTGEIEVIYNVINSGSNTTRYSFVGRARAAIGRSWVVWYAPEALPMKSYKPMSVVTCDGITHLVHGGYSSITEIWWSFRDGGDWVTDMKVPNQWSGAGATLGCFEDSKTVMVHNVSGGTDLMQSVFGP